MAEKIDIVKVAQEIEGKNRKLFNVKELLAEIGQIKETYDEKLGTIKYGSLTYSDWLEIIKISNESEKALDVTFRMLSKADASITKEDLLKLDSVTISRLQIALALVPDFLELKKLSPTILPDGSTAPTPPK